MQVAECDTLHCCSVYFDTYLHFVLEVPITLLVIADHMLKEAEEDFGTGKFSRHQKFLWDLMEHSESSTMAQIVSIMSMSFVGVSIVGMIVNTLEATQYTVKLPADSSSLLKLF